MILRSSVGPRCCEPSFVLYVRYAMMNRMPARSGLIGLTGLASGRQLGVSAVTPS